MFKIYDAIIPVGIGCTVSFHLKKNGLREYSLPFDWIYGITINKAYSLIESSFQGFLDKDNLKFSYICGIHNVYSNTELNINFVHDFPQNPSSKINISDQVFAEVKRKYDRRIKRLYEILNTKKKILFIHYSEGACPEDIISLERNRLNLCKIFPQLKIDILYIYTKNTLNKKIEKINKHIHLVPMPIPDNLSPENRWIGNSKQFKLIFKKFTTNTKMKGRIFNFFKIKNKKMLVDNNFFND